MPVLNAENVTAGYGQRIVLGSLSINIEPGLVTALVGPNGSGKSTLLRCLGGALRPVQGRVLVGGKDLYQMSANHAAKRITYVPQETPMTFAFTVEELIRLSSGGTSKAAADAISFLELGPLAHSALNRLSGGEQQRAAIARGLAQETDCLLLDEPTAHLDLRFQYALFNLLRQRTAQHGTTVVIVLHDLVLAARCADRIILLNKGTVEGSGLTADVMTKQRLEKVYGISLEIQKQGDHILAITAAENLTFS